MKSDWSWIRSVTTMSGPSDGKDECPPAIGNPATAATQSEGTRVPIGRNAGGHPEAGMESEEGTAF